MSAAGLPVQSSVARGICKMQCTSVIIISILDWTPPMEKSCLKVRLFADLVKYKCVALTLACHLSETTIT